MLEKPNIKPCAEIVAMLMTLDNCNGSIIWVVENYYNIIWDYSQSNLQICGDFGKNAYQIIETCPFIEYKKWNISEFGEQDLSLLDEGYGILLPINTKKMGITEKTYFHNIFVEEKEQDKLRVYDFWAPKFHWEMKIMDSKILLAAIDNKIREEVVPIAIKKRKVTQEKICFEPRMIIQKYLSANSSSLSLEAYDRWIETIEQLKSVYYLNHVDFNNLYEHFIVWEIFVQLLDEKCEKRILNSDIFVMKKMAIELRNYSMKVWRMSNQSGTDWKNVITDKIKEIKDKEYNFMYKLLTQLEHCG